MVRVIAGQCRGRHLQVGKGERIRPTSDRVRKSLFDILGERVVGAHVLDLFAGAGTLGIEALSRGALRALFVDAHGDSVACIRHNLALCRLTEQGEVLRASASAAPTFARISRSGTPPFSLLFLDPPYGLNLIPEALTQTIKSGIMAPDAWAVAESDADWTPPVTPGWAHFRQGRYGRTRLWFFARATGDSSLERDRE